MGRGSAPLSVQPSVGRGPEGVWAPDGKPAAEGKSAPGVVLMMVTSPWIVPAATADVPRALLVTLPVLVLTLVIQKEIVGGLTAGGVKG